MEKRPKANISRTNYLEDREPLQGRSLKGNRNNIEVPKQQTNINFPNKMPDPNKRTSTKTAQL